MKKFINWLSVWFFGQRHVWFFSREAINKQLETHNRDLISELFPLIRAQLTSEGERAKTLDSKSTSLFSPIGILATACGLAFSIKPDVPYASVLNSPVGICITILSLALLGVSIFTIFGSIKMKTVNTAPGEADFFETIAFYDGRDDDNTALADGHDYRRYLCEHYWHLYCAAHSNNERKARWVKVAQFLVYAALTFIIGFQIFAVVKISLMSNSNTTTTQTAQPASTSAPSPVMVAPAPPKPVQISTTGTPVTNSHGGPVSTRAVGVVPSVPVGIPANNKGK